MKYTAPLSVFLLLAIGFNGLAWSNTCRSLLESTQTQEAAETLTPTEFSNAPLSIQYYLNRVPDRFSGKELHPHFIEPSQEKALVPLWRGSTEAPLAISQTFINQTYETGLVSTALIDYQLLAADKGVVKTSTPGFFMSLRWNEEWRGHDMSTNMGVFAPSFVKASTTDDYPYVVSSDAKAVFLFLHGGGTATTGHHVAANITNYLGHRGVAVVSIDSLYHAYGPRADVTPQEYYEYLKDLRYKIAPEGVPVFVGGHSMGGEHADNLMRMSERFGIGEAFAGFISLSTPLDEAPGESQERKEEVKEEILARPEVQERIPEIERELNVSLFLQGKIAQLSGISTSHFSSQIDWVTPEHNGAEWSPALYLMGEFDALYVGREELFQNYVTDLENTEVLIMGDRIDHNGNQVRVGHMIFDHQMPEDKSSPESFTVIRNFIADVIGQSLSDKVHVGTHGTLTNLMVQYYTNLAFRIFMDEHQLLYSKGTKLLTSLGQESKELGGSIKRLSGEIGRLKKAGEDFSAQQSELEEVQKRLSEIREFQRLTYVPHENSPGHEFAIENIRQRKQVETELGDIFSQRKTIEKPLKALRDPIAARNKAVEGFVTTSLYADESELPESLKPQRSALMAYIDEIVVFYKQISDENGDYALQESENETFRVDPPEELKEKYRQLSTMHETYVRMEEEVREQIRVLIAQGVYGEEVQAKLIDLYGSVAAVQNNAPTPESLLGTEHDLRTQFEALSTEHSRLEFLKENLELAYINEVLPLHHTARLTTGNQELGRPLEALIENDSTLQDLWKRWNSIWRARPADAQTSLY